ncbi:hypothetical protein GCM10022224_074820 [Nonomuraea antimicrobica]|uniref:PPM-type phosphatase domain-containing protein n=1 Tax=Nonomuraea antimicrobica TaxID=561173 RepID=A0ABP7D0W2_9ACTN
MTEMTHCVTCGGTVAPDGHCWDCGTPQPAFRSHLELTVGGAAGVSERGPRRGVNSDAMALVRAGVWTVGAVCDGVSMAPRADRAARVAAYTGAATTAARLRTGALPETALVAGALHAARAVASLTAIRATVPPPGPAEGADHRTIPDPARVENRTIPEPARANHRTIPDPAHTDHRTTPDPAHTDHRTTPDPAHTDHRTTPDPAHTDHRTTPDPARAEHRTALSAAWAGLGVGAPSCTYVAGVVGPEGVWSCWIGDSRAYWLPGEGLGMALTEDDTGEHEALSAWLGADAGPSKPRLRSYQPRVPGRLLLCTDGLWRHLPDAASLRVHALPGDPLAAARSLIAYALGAGGQDDVTALLIDVHPGDHPGDHADDHAGDLHRQAPPTSDARGAATTGPTRVAGVPRSRRG